MKVHALAFGVVAAFLAAPAAYAASLTMVSGATGEDAQFVRSELDKFEQATGDKVSLIKMPPSSSDQFGQYRLWLAAGNSDIDVYQTDVIWAPQLADQFIDLADAAKGVVKDHFPSIIQSQTVNGKLVALPFYTDAPALFYRSDLLTKYGLKPPTTWDEMASEAKTVMDGERAAGAKDLWGFVFQGAAYEGLTCNALEWIKSSGGGEIVEADGKISINNPAAAKALERAKGWINAISPPGVLGYHEEESRGVWQVGNAVFMRNWPYAFALGNGADSQVKGKFDVVPLPSGAAGQQSSAALGGWNLAVSKYSKSRDEAIKLALFLASSAVQKDNALTQRASADHRRPLRRSRHRQAPAGAGQMEADLRSRGSAAIGADQGEIQRGLVAVLVGGARHAGWQRRRRGQSGAARREARRTEERRLVSGDGVEARGGSPRQVIPAKAGIQAIRRLRSRPALGPRFRGGDMGGRHKHDAGRRRPRLPAVTVTAPALVQPTKRSPLQRRRVRAALVFLAPAAIALCAVAGWPLARTIAFSFTDASLEHLQGAQWIGGRNYFSTITLDSGRAIHAGVLADPGWWRAVANTLGFAVTSVAIETVLGMAIALALNAKFRGRGLMRAAILVPWAIPTVVSARMWSWMLNDQFGIVNDALMRLGLIDHKIAWTVNPDTAMICVIAVDVWKTAPFMALLILAGLQAIPDDIYEAAAIDGVSPIAAFFNLTLPLVRPALLVAMIFRFLDAMRMFDLVYVLTPNSAQTATVSAIARDNLFDFDKFAYGCSEATLTFLIILAAVILTIRVGRLSLA